MMKGLGLSARARRRSLGLILCLGAVILGDSLGCVSTVTHVRPVSHEVNQRLDELSSSQEEVTRDATLILSRLIQAKSVNPPGDEALVTSIIASLLGEVGVQGIRQEIGPRRENIYAILEPKEPPLTPTDVETLCLLSHADVVPADEESWGRDPFSGEIQDGYIWGRGALDMKGITALHIALFRWVKRQVDRGHFKLKRRLALLVVADEEVDNLGMRALVRERWSDLKCSHVINEGAFGVRDLIFKGQDVMPISVGEKGVLWVKLKVKSTSGHGSVPREHFAPHILLSALERVRAYEPQPVVSEALTELFYLLGDDYGGLTGFILKRPLLTRWFALDELLSVPESASGIRHTFHVTGFNTGIHKPNVVPAQASALVDIRIIAGVQPDAILKRLEEIIGDERVKIEVLTAFASDVSSWRDDPVYHSIVRHSQRVFPHAVVGPATSVGFTDSIYARRVGARAYGWAPFMISREELEGMHGEHERLPLKQLSLGVNAALGLALDLLLTSR